MKLYSPGVIVPYIQQESFDIKFDLKKSQKLSTGTKNVKQTNKHECNTVTFDKIRREEIGSAKYTIGVFNTGFKRLSY